MGYHGKATANAHSLGPKRGAEVGSLGWLSPQTCGQHYDQRYPGSLQPQRCPLNAENEYNCTYGTCQCDQYGWQTWQIHLIYCMDVWKGSTTQKTTSTGWYYNFFLLPLIQCTALSGERNRHSP